MFLRTYLLYIVLTFLNELLPPILGVVSQKKKKKKKTLVVNLKRELLTDAFKCIHL